MRNLGAVGLVAVMIMSSCARSNSPSTSGTWTRWPTPNQRLTPGSIVTGCTYPRPTSQRLVTRETRDAVRSAYKYSGPAGLAHVEYDHRVPFSLCGGNDAANIWPEAADGTQQSQYVHNHKDELENYAAAQVRAGHWTLEHAQQLFLRDWRRAWCSSIHTPGAAC